MSLKTDRLEYERAYAERSNQLIYVDPQSAEARIINWSPNMLLIAASAEHGENIARLFDSLVERDSFLQWTRPGEPAENLAGYYKRTPLSVMHTGITPAAFGASYVDMGLNRLRLGRVQNIVVVGELSALQENVKLGDLVVATSAIREDDSHLSYAHPDLPAVSDARISRAITTAARATGHPTHVGVCWSCGAGAGIYDPSLTHRAWELHQLGVLGNAVEAATAYLLGSMVGFRVGSLWLAADSVFEPITWQHPSPRLDWEQGWSWLVQAGLDALALLAAASPSES
ncbi:MAG TPA: hypothetical protein VFD70_14565 [Anaerolineae bacterium]|nr:hypothetical protein [Anaerolineae bacterium]